MRGRNFRLGRGNPVAVIVRQGRDSFAGRHGSGAALMTVWTVKQTASLAGASATGVTAAALTAGLSWSIPGACTTRHQQAVTQDRQDEDAARRTSAYSAAGAVAPGATKRLGSARNSSRQPLEQKVSGSPLPLARRRAGALNRHTADRIDRERGHRGQLPVLQPQHAIGDVLNPLIVGNDDRAPSLLRA